MFINVQRFAFKTIGKYIEGVLPKFYWLEFKMRKGRINTSLRMYLSVAIFWMIFSTIVAIPSAGLILAFMSLLLNDNVIFFTAGYHYIAIYFLMVAATPFVILSYYLYNPDYQISERKRKLESDMPTASSYMTAMASAGVTPDSIFKSLAKEEIGYEIVFEAQTISRDMEIFGYDIIHALKQASERSPSPKFSSFLQGIIAVFTAGGSLQLYLTTETKALMRDKIQDEKDFINSLGLMAELFLVVGVVAPVFFIIMLAMMTVMSTGGGATTLFMGVLVYIIMPALMGFILIMLDAAKPLD